MALTRKYEVEAMSNGYSIKILEATGGDGPIAWVTVAHYVVGGMKAGTEPETLRRKLSRYAVGELKEQLEKAIEEADNARPALVLDEEPVELELKVRDPEATEPQGD